MNRKAALILPFQLDRNKTFIGNFSYEAIARLKPGITIASGQCRCGAHAPDDVAEISSGSGHQSQNVRRGAIRAECAAAESGRGRRHRKDACGC